MNRKQRRTSAAQGCPAPIAAAPDLAGMFAGALRHHQAGRLHPAELLYRQVLAANPRHADSLHLLGLIADQAGFRDQAEALIRRAVTAGAGEARYHCSLGNIVVKQGRLDEAAACYRTAIGLKPGYPEAHHNLGIVLRSQGNPGGAVASFRKAISLRPAYADAHHHLGIALGRQGLQDEAAACYRKVVSLKPDCAGAHHELGRALAEQGHPEEAAACYGRAVAIRPDYVEAHNNLANALKEQGRLGEAVECYRKAISLMPDYPFAHFNMSLALLGQGNLAEGWREYEWRQKLVAAPRVFAQPQWRGEAADGKTLLIHAEQGFGDTLQFCRYAEMAAARGLRVIMEVQTPLVRLLRSLPAGIAVFGRGDELPPFDLHCPMLGMPLALGTVLDTIPGGAPYLHADAAAVASWLERLAALPGSGPRVGLVWAGNPTNSPVMAARDRQRSIAPERLAPLLAIPGLRFFSLQKGEPAAPAGFPLTDFMGEMEDFADTAALVANLDLVVSVDTAVVHLAAAMGKPVWVMDRFDPCWRWLTGRRDSPWYPSVRLYRQPRAGDWESVLAEVAIDLTGMAAGMEARAD